MMKSRRITLLTFATLMLAFIFSGCGNVTVSNDEAVKNTNEKTVESVDSMNENKPTEVANTNVTQAESEKKPVDETKKSEEKAPLDEEGSESFEGELQLGKTESVILYFGEESGDYAAYCFTNNSEVGKKILASCKDEEQCEIKGSVDGEIACKVPGLEVNLSDSGKIMEVSSVKSLGRRK